MLKLNRTIVLVGLMGAGKTSIGRRVAKKLGVRFYDADAEIEKAAGCKVSDIFEIFGEAEFRAGERRVISRLLNKPPHVLATGGGAFMDETTRKAIKDKSISVWLRADVDILHERTSRRNTRPLLQGGDSEKILQRLIKERYPIYAEADITVDSADAPLSVMVDKVIHAVKSHSETPANV